MFRLITINIVVVQHYLILVGLALSPHPLYRRHPSIGDTLQSTASVHTRGIALYTNCNKNFQSNIFFFLFQVRRTGTLDISM